MNLIHFPSNYSPSTSTLFWFRRDLRLSDNTAFYHALKENEHVLPIFIFDKQILDKLEDKADRRVEFIHETLINLKKELETLGSSLLMLHGNPIEIFRKIKVRAVYVNHDYEPYARKRDEEVKEILHSKGTIFKSFKDHVIFEKNEILKDDKTPYTIFTPYSKKWKANLNSLNVKNYPVEKYFKNLQKVQAIPSPSLYDIGFIKTGGKFPKQVINKSIIEKYKEKRDYPAKENTTKLSVHLRFGTVSVRKLVKLAQQTSETWLNELIWREFYHMILWHFPNVEKAFKPAYDRVIWKNDLNEFTAWCEGRTGYPIVDAGMRELNTTGFMHNRVRMIVASFLTKHLLIDWRWGEAYFAQKLLDFDLASNNGGWQWAAGSGCDAAPYFRVFNPYVQAKKFDPKNIYIKKWVPEFETTEYPAPLVDHTFARMRVLKAYKDALTK